MPALRLATRARGGRRAPPTKDALTLGRTAPFACAKLTYNAPCLAPAAGRLPLVNTAYRLQLSGASAAEQAAGSAPAASGAPVAGSALAALGHGYLALGAKT